VEGGHAAQERRLGGRGTGVGKANGGQDDEREEAERAHDARC